MKNTTKMQRLYKDVGNKVPFQTLTGMGLELVDLVSNLPLLEVMSEVAVEPGY